MPRVPRWMQLARDAAYHVMTRGHNREVLFVLPQSELEFAFAGVSGNTLA